MVSDQQIAAMLKQAEEKSLLRIATAGSVDDGKSTLIGRLLHDSKGLYEDQLAAVAKRSKEGKVDFALLTDGLKAEREQGITIDVAYRYFSTPKRHFILADTPGHEQYTRNMATGASTANLAILVVDARNGMTTQTKRHAFIASLLGIPRLLVTINKMDLVDFSQKRYEEIKADFVDFATKLSVKNIQFIPISALEGDNVVHLSKHMSWYEGEPVMTYLENVYVDSDRNHVDFRLPVQYVIRPHQDYRGFAGRIASGVLRPGDEIMSLPSGQEATVASIDTFDGSVEQAFTPMSVTVTLDREIDISRGDMIVKTSNVPRSEQRFEAMLVWMADQKSDPNTQYWIKHTSRTCKASIDQLLYRVDVNTLNRNESETLGLNDIGRVTLATAQPIFYDTYEKNRETGSFILIDPLSNLTVAAGMIIDRLPSKVLKSKTSGGTEAKPVSQNIHREEGTVSLADREARNGHSGMTFWFTGLSGSGKSAIAVALERKLFDEGIQVYRLDGDNLRFGLNRDLGFSKQDRRENIRRVAEVARLFNRAGIVTLCSFISPFKQDREDAKEIVGDRFFKEIYVSTSLEECERRDVQGLYKKARSGEIQGFTGVSAPYEAPESPAIAVNTENRSLEDCVNDVYELFLHSK